MYGGTLAARLVAAGGILLAIGAFVLLGTHRIEAYPGTGRGAFVATAVATCVLLAASVAAIGSRTTRRAGVLGVLITVAWLSPVALGWLGGPGWLRAVAMLAAPALVPLLVHLIVQQSPSGASPAGRSLVVASYLGAAGLSIAVVVTRDPLLDLDCWRDCAVRSLAVAPDAGLAEVAGQAWLYFVIGAAVLATLCAAAAGARAQPMVRADVAAVCLSAALVLATCAWSAVLHLQAHTDRPTAALQTAYLGQAVSLLLLGAGLGWQVWRGARRRSAMRSMAARLGTAPRAGGLREQLAVVLEDPSVEVAYWLPEDRRYVDGSGAPVAPRAGAERVSVEVRRHDDRVALVTLAGPRADGDQLVEQIGATAQLAVDNERLRAAVLAQLAELNASRRRIVAASDETRRGIERDLHDGAQADLVSLIYEIAGARARAERAGEVERAELLADINAEVSAIAGRLREFTHGIFPPVLAEAGLEPALWSLIDEAPAPVVLDISLIGRPSTAAERAAYLVAAHAIGHAPPGGALDLRVRGDAERVRVWVGRCDDLPVELTDRVGALGGAVVASGDGWEVTLPCVSS